MYASWRKCCPVCSTGGGRTCRRNLRTGRRGQLQGVARGSPVEGDNPRDRHRDGLQVQAVEAQRSHGDGDLHRHQQGQGLPRLQDRREEDSAARARALRDVAGHVLEEGTVPLPLDRFRPGSGRHEGRLLGGRATPTPTPTPTTPPPPRRPQRPPRTPRRPGRSVRPTRRSPSNMFDNTQTRSTSFSLRRRCRRAWSRS